MGKVCLLYVGNFTHNQFKSNTFYEKFHENICIFKHNDWFVSVDCSRDDFQ